MENGKRMIQRLSGTGDLASSAGDVVSVYYDLRVWQDHSDGIPTLRSADGQVMASEERSRLELSETPYVLTLADGSKVKGFVTDDKGGFICTGAFYK